MEGRYNTRSPAVKRLMREAQELSEPTDQYFAQPLDDNLFEWHFTVRGPADSDFQNGIYHGRIILPVDYPMKPPSIIWLTPNGRFETNKKICLSISGHHPESWQPSWSIRTALLAIIGFMPTHPGGAIGSLDYKPEERKTLARKSREWKCPSCGDVQTILLEPSSEPSSASEEAKQLAAQINFQGEKPKGKTDENPVETVIVTATTTSLSSSAQPLPVSNSVSSGPSATLSQSATGANTTSFIPNQFAPWGFPPGAVPPVPPAPGLNSFASPFCPFPWTPPPSTATSRELGAAAMIPRFPFPPSHYTGGYVPPFYPPGFAMPPMGLFPHCPILPSPNVERSYVPNTSTSQSASPEMHNRPVHVNNSSLADHMSTNATVTSSSYTRSPMTSPPVNRHPSCDPNQSSVTAENTQSSPDRSNLMAELLNKVKRVGSDEKSPSAEAPSQDLKNETSTADDELMKALAKRRQLEAVGDSSQKEEIRDQVVNMASGGTDSEVSLSLKKKETLSELTDGEVTQSELLADGEDNSESGVPPIEMSDTEQRSALEKSTSSSMSELEKHRLRQQGAKSLRQRQSATARVPSEVIEDVPNSSEQPTPATGRQRIEAASGDTTMRNQPRPQRAGNGGLQGIQQNYRDVLAEVRQRNSPYDFSFIVMVALSLATIIIFLNRFLQNMEWLDMYMHKFV